MKAHSYATTQAMRSRRSANTPQITAQGGSANGPLASGKDTIWEGGVRVPLIMRGRRVKVVVCFPVRDRTADVFPTIAAIGRVNSPSHQTERRQPRGVLVGQPNEDCQ